MCVVYFFVTAASFLQIFKNPVSYNFRTSYTFDL